VLDETLLPTIIRVIGIAEETSDVRTLELEFQDPAEGKAFGFAPGQFCLISVFGTGEAPFCIASSPLVKDYFEVTVKKLGKVTTAIHDLEIDDILGFRGPYGNSFPLEDIKGRDVVVAAGGIGIAPLRPVILKLLADRGNYGRVLILYGAVTAHDLLYKRDLKEWEKRGDVEVVTTVDPGGEDANWKGKIGFVPAVLEELRPSGDSVLLTCGPPVMLKVIFESARRLGFEPEDIITSLEMKMTCGVGTCGRCNIGSVYVCKDGPVFTLKQIEALPNEF
jgi:sulfhydrogenase subunit gamma (sulfur reductase)